MFHEHGTSAGTEPLLRAPRCCLCSPGGREPYVWRCWAEGDPASRLTVSPTSVCRARTPSAPAPQQPPQAGRSSKLGTPEYSLSPEPPSRCSVIHRGPGRLLGSHPRVLSPGGRCSGRGKVAFTASCFGKQSSWRREQGSFCRSAPSTRPGTRQVLLRVSRGRL